jgi:hypothetical protein
MTTSTAQSGQPWARAAGLLGGCATVISGVVRSVDPDIIVYRATIAAVGVALIVRLFFIICDTTKPQDDEDE